jgi:peptide/nickel transport system substrate-binding protein
VLPPLFDSTFNITAAGTGRDYGGWANAEWNARSDQIAAIKDRTEREKAWVAADDVLLGDGAYIALAARYSTHLAGSDVRGLQAQPHGGGTIDLAVAGVK